MREMRESELMQHIKDYVDLSDQMIDPSHFAGYCVTSEKKMRSILYSLYKDGILERYKDIHGKFCYWYPYKRNKDLEWVPAPRKEVTNERNRKE